MGGGTIVAATSPEGLLQVKASHTGRALAPVLARERNDAPAPEEQGVAKIG